MFQTAQHKCAVMREYDERASTYDEEFGMKVLYANTSDTTLRLLDLEYSPRILEVGCGTGLMTERIVKARPDVELVGLDISIGILKKAKEKGLGTHWIQADMNHMPFIHNSFDRLLSVFNFSLVARPHKTEHILNTFRNMLRENGRLLILDANRAQEVFKALVGVKSRDWYFFPSEVISALMSSGFEINDFVEFSMDIPKGWEIPERRMEEGHFPKEYDTNNIVEIMRLLPFAYLIVASFRDKINTPDTS